MTRSPGILLLAAVAALALAACSRDVPALVEEVETDSTQHNLRGVWREEDLAGGVDSIMAEYAALDGPGAAVLVARQGEPLVMKGYGLAELETARAVTPTTNFRLASLTKQFNATTILILRGEGLLSLDDPIVRYLPELPAYANNVTVRQLLQHISGLPDYEDYLRITHLVPVREREVPFMIADAESLLAREGTTYHYSNTGYALLGVIAERAAGLPFPEVLRTRIFAPAGMDGSIAYVAEGPPVRERAYGYSRAQVLRKWKRTDQSMTSAVLGDGGIYSSVRDVLQWDRAWNGCLLLDSLTQEEAFTPGTLVDGSRTKYGYGWMIEHYRGLRAVAHSGGTMGFTHFMVRFPEDRFTVVILSNRDQASVVPLVFRIVDLYLAGTTPPA
jgi:CubicO group peptidase (beta-lactamase class C family)